MPQSGSGGPFDRLPEDYGSMVLALAGAGTRPAPETAAPGGASWARRPCMPTRRSTYPAVERRSAALAAAPGDA